MLSEPVLYHVLGDHIGHTITVLPIFDEHDSDRPDTKRVLHCEDCDRTFLTTENPDLELEG